MAANEGHVAGAVVDTSAMSVGGIQARAEEEISLQQVLDRWPVRTDPRVHAESIGQLIDVEATQFAIYFGPRPEERS